MSKFRFFKPDLYRLLTKHIKEANDYDARGIFGMADMYDATLLRYAQEEPNVAPQLSDEYQIPEWRLGKIQAKIDQLNRRALKLGLEPITVEILDKFTKTIKSDTDFDKQIPYLKIAIHGQPPKVNGWSFVGTVAHHPSGHNIIKGVPGHEIPSEYRERGNICDHCGTMRPRNETMILINDNGEHKQVGRSCLKDFLGHSDPRNHAAYAEYLQDMYGSIDEDDEEENYGRSRGDKSDTINIGIQDFLALAAAYVRQYGYISVAKAQESETLPSSWDLRQIMDDRKGASAIKGNDPKSELQRQKRATLFTSVTPEDQQSAEEVLDWIRGMQQDEGQVSRLSDYLYNIVTAVNTGVVDRHTFGLLMSSIPAFHKYKEKQIERTQQQEVEKATGPDYESLGYAGEEGQRVNLVVTVDRVTPYEGSYGMSYIHGMTDKDGRKISWFGSKPLEVGRVYSMMAAVKKQKPANPNSQKPWERIPQTEITRPTKIVEMDSPGKANAEQEKLDAEEAKKQHFVNDAIPRSREQILNVISKLLESGKGSYTTSFGDQFSWDYNESLHQYVMFVVRGLGDSVADAFRSQHQEDIYNDKSSLEQMAYRYVREQTDPIAKHLFTDKESTAELSVRAETLLVAIDHILGKFLSENGIGV